MAISPSRIAVAETLEAAFEAADRVVVRYAAEKPSVTFDSSMPTAYVPKKMGGAGDPADEQTGRPGRRTGFGRRTRRRDLPTPFQTHSPMEPHATIAVWDGPQKLTLYDTSQGIFGDRKRVAALLGLAAGKRARGLSISSAAASAARGRRGRTA